MIQRSKCLSVFLLTTVVLNFGQALSARADETPTRNHPAVNLVLDSARPTAYSVFTTPDDANAFASGMANSLAEGVLILPPRGYGEYYLMYRGLQKVGLGVTTAENSREFQRLLADRDKMDPVSQKAFLSFLRESLKLPRDHEFKDLKVYLRTHPTRTTGGRAMLILEVEHDDRNERLYLTPGLDKTQLTHVGIESEWHKRGYNRLRDELDSASERASALRRENFDLSVENRQQRSKVTDLQREVEVLQARLKELQKPASPPFSAVRETDEENKDFREEASLSTASPGTKSASTAAAAESLRSSGEKD